MPNISGCLSDASPSSKCFIQEVQNNIDYEKEQDADGPIGNTQFHPQCTGAS